MIRNTFIKILALTACLVSFTLASPVYSPHKYQQNDWFGEFGENTSMYVNPAGIAETDQWEVAGGLFSTISGEAGQQYLTTTIPYDYKHTFGLSVFFNGATIEGGQRYVENSYMLGYAYRLIHALAIGFDLSILQINQFDINKQLTVGADVGVSWNPIANSRLGHLQVGVAVQNAFAPAITTSDDESFKFVHMFSDEAYRVPTNLNVSLFWRGLNKMLEAKAEVSVVDLLVDTDEEGGDGPHIENSFTFTYYLSHLLGVRARFTKEGYPVLGATVNVKDVNLFKYLELDLEMSHDDIIEKKNRGFIWNVRLTARFGPTREESIGLRRYQRLKIEPENDYRRAMRLYLDRQFLEAAYAFGKVITKYPAFHLVDQAAYYKGKSFENMRMHKAARTTYKNAIKKYPHSDQVAKYNFQLMNIDYKEEKYSEAILKYQEIAQKYSDSDVKGDADYVSGQIKFLQGLYQESIDLLSPILPGNANYFYARYTMGISYSRLSKWKESEDAFKDVIAQQHSNKSEEDIKDAAKVKLGHLYFSADEPNLPEAAALYGQIKPGSHVYDEAMLAIAWTFLKVAKPQQALPVAQWIINNMPNSFLLSEAYLVAGYSHHMLKDCKNASKSLGEAIKLTEKPKVSQASKDSARQAYDAMVGDFENVQETALDLARQLPTERVKMKRGKLQPKFEKANKSIDDFYKFQKLSIQSDRFDANRKRVLEDAEFTKATVDAGCGDGGGEDLGLEELGDL